MSDEEQQNSSWNIDGLEHQLIFNLKSSIVYKLKNWDLDLAYWDLRLMRAEIDAKFSRGNKSKIELESEMDKRELEKNKESEKQQVDRLMKELQEYRDKYVSLSVPNDHQKGEFFILLETFYMHLCFLMKVHGMYFKDGDSTKIAVLRR